MFSLMCRIMRNKSRIQKLAAKDPVGNAKIIKALIRENRKLEKMNNV